MGHVQGWDPLSEIPKPAARKWYRYTVRKIVQYQWLMGRISVEEKVHVEQLARARQKAEVPHAPALSVDDFIESIKRIEDERYRLAYLIMYFSGARAEEAARLLRGAVELRRVTHEQSLRYKGYVVVTGNAVRVALHYNRGKKRCDFLWLPHWLFDLLRAKHIVIDARALSTYARKHDAMHVKLVHKLHYQLMEDLGIGKEVREVIQNRVGELDVGDIHYSKVILRADKIYSEVVLPALGEALREITARQS